MSKAAAPKDAVDVNPEHVRLVHDVATVVNIESTEALVYFTLQFAAVPHEGLHSTGVPGHKIVDEEPPIIKCPFVLSLSDGQDIIIGAMKHREDQSFF